MFPKRYETLLQRECASCSINISDDSPKAIKLRLLTTDRFEELSNIEVLSYIYGITALELTTNLIHNIENIFSEDDVDIASVLEDSNSIKQICNNICLVLCQSCAPKLAELYGSYKNFANTLAFNCLISKATKNVTIGQNLFTGCSQQTEKQNNSLPCNVQETESSSLKIEEFDHVDSDDYNCDDDYIFPASPEEYNDETNVKLALEPLDELRREYPNDHTDEVPNKSSGILVTNGKTETTDSHRHPVPSFPSRLYCKLCDIQFTSDYAILVHKVEVHDKQQFTIWKAGPLNGPPFFCPLTLCGKMYRNRFSLKYHCALQHQLKFLSSKNNEETSFCEICRLTFPSSIGLTAHRVKIHKDVVSQDSKCRQCDKQFESNSELHKHGLKSHFLQLSIQKYQISENTKTRCLLCNSVFEDQLEINTHVEIMHNSANWTQDSLANYDEENECKINMDENESLNTIDEIDVSPTTNRGENSSETSKRNLEVTVSSKTDWQGKYKFSGQQFSTHPKVIKGPPYVCPLCSQSYKKLETLKTHCRRCHNLLLPAQRCRKSKKVSHHLSITCGICLKVFPNEELLQSHNLQKCEIEIPSKESFDNSESPENVNISEEDQELYNTFSGKSNNEVLQNDQQLQVVEEKSEANKSISTQLSCLECAITIKNTAGLKSHYKRVHKLLFVCMTCHKAFLEEKMLELHNCEDYLGKKNPDASCAFKRTILCPFCDKSFDETSSEYNSHVSESHKSELEKIADYKCTICLQQCSSDEVLQAHNKCHSYGYPLNRCELCDKNCMNANALIIHKNNFHRLELLLPVIRSACSICSWPFRKTYDLRMHIKNVHSTIRCHECTTCHMKFKTEKYLKRHIRTHTAEKLYKCSICNFSFLEKQPWKNHMEGHNTECVFPCEVCGKVFQRRYNLRIHSQIHTMTTKSFFCEECGSGFKLYAHLQKHKRLQHEKPLNQNTESYICSICGLVMKHSKSLARHMDWKHSNDPSKKIICVLCGKELRDKYKLQDHLKNKHPNEEYPE